ncbi:MAG: transcriptional regulator with XRE-family HTH domain [Bermanella sp.]|jgi:transcriptional regulator with XRE-family HTH domain
MQVKTLRLHKSWSQEQLAQLCGLNVRTIQRIEKGESVGFETLESLAAVFEIDVNDLKTQNNDKRDLPNIQEEMTIPPDLEEQKSLAKEKVQSIKYFYITIAVSLGLFIFIFLPNYNQGENLEPLIVLAIAFALRLLLLPLAFLSGCIWPKVQHRQIHSSGPYRKHVSLSSDLTAKKDIAYVTSDENMHTIPELYN